jgi:hypothetical protein
VRFLAGVVLALALVPLAAAAPSWKTHQVKAAGFRVAAPATWIDVTRLTPQVLAKENEVPGLRAYVEAARKSKLIKLIVVDVGPTTVKNHFASGVNVTQVPTIGDLRLQRDATIAQLKAAGILVGAVQSRYVSLAAGKALRLSYRARFAAGTPVVASLQFVFVHAGKATVLTYTTLPKLQSHYATTFARSAHSFRFVAS